MLALVSAALIVASSAVAAPVMDAPAVVINHFGMEDIVPAASGTSFIVRGEASLIIANRTVMYDLAGRKSNGDLVFASPRTSNPVKRWNWYSTGMFTTTTWF